MTSRVDRFDRADLPIKAEPKLATSTPVTPLSSDKLVWPIPGIVAKDVGDKLMAKRRGRPHKGIDMHAPAGTKVIAARAGVVIRVIDGRKGTTEGLKQAGLFVDIRGTDSIVYRYLHLGSASVRAGESVATGDTLATVARAGSSGVGTSTRPHLHFEMRSGDYSSSRGDYGPEMDPTRFLPALIA